LQVLATVLPEKTPKSLPLPLNGPSTIQTVKTFSRIFHENSGFNEDIGAWNVSRATSMNSMFFSAKAFNEAIYILLGCVLHNRHVQSVFFEAKNFNQDIV
jgi:Mycoplasma protein of unknown function, DUF285